MATNQGKALSDGRAVARIERSDGESLEDHLKKIPNPGINKRDWGLFKPHQRSSAGAHGSQRRQG